MAMFLVGAFCIGLPQNVISANLTPMARHFNLTDAERDLMLGGWMSTAFFLVGAPASVAVGVLVGRLNRKGVLLGLCCLTGLTSLFSAAAQTVWQLVVLRAVLGFATGALQPLLYSVVGDLFPPAARPAWASYVGIALGGGVAIGQLFAGASATQKRGIREPRATPLPSPHTQASSPASAGASPSSPSRSRRRPLRLG